MAKMFEDSRKNWKNSKTVLKYLKIHKKIEKNSKTVLKCWKTYKKLKKILK